MLVLMIVIIFTITRSLLLGGYAELERQNLLQNADQAVKVLEHEIASVKSVAGDWAPWDETYEFVQDLNQEYINNNLADSTINILPVDFLIYLNVDHKHLYCKYVDPATEQDAVCPASLTNHLLNENSLIKNNNSSKPSAGLSLLPDGPVMVASAPILTSQFKGPVRGTLIVGRYLNKLETEHLSNELNLSIVIHRTDSPELPPGFENAKQSLSIKEHVTVNELDENTIAAYALLTDLQNKPILILGIDREREIYAQGKKSLNYFAIAILITGSVFIIASLLFLETTILSRVLLLSAEVKNIGHTKDLTTRTTSTGNDELSDLADEINQMLESVQMSTERDRAILETIEDGYFELDLKGRVTFYNDALSRLLRNRIEDLHKMNYRQLFDADSAGKTFSAFKQLYETGNPIKTMETRFSLDNGEQIILESTVSIIRDNTGATVGFRGISRDVTEKKKASEKLLFIAYHDALTGLLNRKSFTENLEEELSYAGRFNQQRSLLLLDLDKFKLVNDTYGHDAGDNFLKDFAKRVKETLRTTDLPYRIGGDEFAIILTDPDNQNGEAVATRIIEMMEKPFEMGKITIDFVTVSIGLSVFPMNGTDAETLVHYADKVMYSAKRTRNTFAATQ